MKQRGVRKDAVKVITRQVKSMEILLHTSHPVSARAMVAKPAAPPSPMGVWPLRRYCDTSKASRPS